MFLRYLLHFDYLNMFLKSLCLRSMLSFCLSNYLAVQSEIIVRMAQMIGMKTNAILKLPMLNHALSRTCNGQSMGNGTRNALTSGERINTQLQNATQHKLYHAILTWYDSISDNSIHAIFVIFIVIIYLTQSDPITETIYALAIA